MSLGVSPVTGSNNGQPPVVLRRQEQSYALHSDLNPLFSLDVGGEEAGYISRGHANLPPEFRGRGVYADAVRQLEDYERQCFQNGRYAEYQRHMIRAMGVETAGQAVSVVMRLGEPHHIDFWRLPAVAARLIELGYTLDYFSRQTLELRHYVRPDATPGELAAALRTHHAALKGYVICILSKAAYSKNPSV